MARSDTVEDGTAKDGQERRANRFLNVLSHRTVTHRTLISVGGALVEVLGDKSDGHDVSALNSSRLEPQWQQAGMLVLVC